MRKGSIAALLGISLVAGGVAAAVALIPNWLPLSASQQADRIDWVTWFTIWMCVVIFAIVVAAIVYSIFRFRAAPDDLEDGPPIHGHTTLEIVWTAIPFVLVSVIAVICAVVLSRNDAQAKDTLHVDVLTQQFAWTFSYPDAGGATSPVLRLPVSSVELDMRSLDVVHSFYVPEFRVTQDIVPGMVTHLHITPTRVGTYPIICHELCGPGHSLMRTQVIVMSDTAFGHWLALQKKAASTP